MDLSLDEKQSPSNLLILLCHRGQCLGYTFGYGTIGIVHSTELFFQLLHPPLGWIRNTHQLRQKPTANKTVEHETGRTKCQCSFCQVQNLN